MDFVSKHTQAMLNIEPRREPLETSIHDPVKQADRYYNSWTIEEKVS
tara:strand:- start:521 stop:661 length:141 start_codon:yes stop_codon:yes gene_type:complete